MSDNNRHDIRTNEDSSEEKLNGMSSAMDKKPNTFIPDVRERLILLLMMFPLKFRMYF